MANQPFNLAPLRIAGGLLVGGAFWLSRGSFLFQDFCQRRSLSWRRSLWWVLGTRRFRRRRSPVAPSKLSSGRENRACRRSQGMGIAAEELELSKIATRLEVGVSPTHPEKSGGVFATSEKFREGILFGANGVVPKPKRFKTRVRKYFGSGTTPSAPLLVPSRYFLLAQPPLLTQEGTRLM